MNDDRAPSTEASRASRGSGRPRLVTIAFSHFCEKARWALDLGSVDYDEIRTLPLYHVPVVLWNTRGGRGTQADRHSSRWSTPVLVTPEGRRLTDSKRITKWVSETVPGLDLHPEAEVDRLEAEFEQLGVDTRRVAYHAVLNRPEVALALVADNVDRWQAITFRWTRPLISRLLEKGLGLRDDRVRRSIERIRGTFDEVGRRLEGRRYLVGDRFTAADLTFACLAAPILCPTRAEGYAASLPPIDELPSAVQSLCRELREHPAGRFALRCLREERCPRPRVAEAR